MKHDPSLQYTTDSDERKLGKGPCEKNKAEYTATPVACGWAGTIFVVT